MNKKLHILGVIITFVIAATIIIFGALGLMQGVPGWKLVVFGVALAICAIIALMDGAQAMPSIGWFKAKGKFQGLSDLGFILIFAILLIASLIIVFG